MVTPAYIDVTLAPGAYQYLSFEVSGLAEGVYEISIQGSPEAGVVTLVVGAPQAPAINIVSFEASPDPCVIGDPFLLTAVVKNEGTASGSAAIVLGYITTAGSKSAMKTQNVSLAAGQQTTVTYSASSTTVGDWVMYAEGPENELRDTLHVVAAPTGAIRVSIVGADPAVAPVSIDGVVVGNTAGGVLVISDLLVGTYTVSVGTAAGYPVTPSPQSVTVLAGQEVTVSFDYLAPGAIVMSNLGVTPDQIYTGESAAVTVRASNTGELSASKRVTVVVTKIG